MSEQESPPAESDADQAPEPIPDFPDPRGGAIYDPRPREDRARRIIAYALIGLLAFVVLGLLGMVVSRIIAVGEIKEFGVILGPLVALVSAATGFYYGNRGS